VAAWLALLAYLAFASAWWRGALARLSRRLGDWTVLLLLLPYLLAVGLRPPPLDLLRFIIYLALPTILLRTRIRMLRVRARPRDARPFDLWHVLTILAIWVPVELDLFVLIADLIVPGVDLRAAVGGFYLLPRIGARLVPGVDLPIHTLTGVLLALFLLLVRHPLSDVGPSFRWRGSDVRSALLGLLGFALVGLPVGLGLRFIRYGPVAPDLRSVLTGVVGGYLLVALPEEVLFRGIIQNLLTKRTQRGALGLAIAAPIFGLAHLNNATPGYTAPNWAYVLVATLAGLAYGWVWMRTKKVTVSALTHMLVNLIWGIVFR
jgi:membrane protease YdiL (CAAX protease family)